MSNEYKTKRDRNHWLQTKNRNLQKQVLEAGNKIQSLNKKVEDHTKEMKDCNLKLHMYKDVKDNDTNIVNLHKLKVENMLLKEQIKDKNRTILEQAHQILKQCKENESKDSVIKNLKEEKDIQATEIKQKIVYVHTIPDDENHGKEKQIAKTFTENIANISNFHFESDLIHKSKMKNEKLIFEIKTGQ